MSNNIVIIVVNDEITVETNRNKFYNTELILILDITNTI